MKKIWSGLALLVLCTAVHAEEGEPTVIKKAPREKGAAKKEQHAFEKPGAVTRARKEILADAIKARLKGRKVLSLDEVLAESLEKSTALKTARLSLENMVENVRRSRYKYIPEFTIEAEGAQNDLETDKLKATGKKGALEKVEGYDEQVLETSATVRQHLPWNVDVTGAAELLQNDRISDKETLRLSISKEILRPDSVSHALTLAKLKLDLQEVSNAETRRRFIYEVKAAYYDYLRAWLIYLNARAKFLADKELNQESEGKFSAGIIAQYQLLDYQRDFTESELSLARHEVAWKTARNALLFLMQRPLDAAIEFNPGVDVADLEREWQARRMIDAALRTSQSVAGLREALLSSEENLEYSRKLLRPSLSVFGSVEEENVTPLKGMDSTDTLSSVGVKLVFPLLQDRFIDRSQVRTRMNDVERGKLELEESFRLYQRTVADDLLAMRMLRKNYELAEKKFRITYVDYELGKLRFETGTIGSYDMIRNKNNFFSANARTIELQYQLLKMEARFERDYPVGEKEESGDDE